MPSSASNPQVRPDPSNNGQTIRKAFLLEATANLMSFPIITNTHFVLSFLLNDPSHINPSSVLFARLFGGIVIGGLTPPLLAGYTNTRNGIESRRVTYTLLGLGECLLIPMLLLEASKGGSKDAALSVRAALGSIALLAPPLLWRLYCMFIRPDIFGSYVDKKEVSCLTDLDLCRVLTCLPIVIGLNRLRTSMGEPLYCEHLDRLVIMYQVSYHDSSYRKTDQANPTRHKTKDANRVTLNDEVIQGHLQTRYAFKQITPTHCLTHFQ